MIYTANYVTNDNANIVCVLLDKAKTIVLSILVITFFRSLAQSQRVEY